MVGGSGELSTDFTYLNTVETRQSKTVLMASFINQMVRVEKAERGPASPSGEWWFGNSGDCEIAIGWGELGRTCDARTDVNFSKNILFFSVLFFHFIFHPFLVTAFKLN